MRTVGQMLSGWGIPFVSAKARHHAGRVSGEVVCETQEQCDAVAERVAGEDGWDVAVRVATAEELADAKRWEGRE